MKTRTFFPPFCFLFFGISLLTAQDGIFTQMLNSPLSLNPALAGMDCGPRFATIFRYHDSPRYFIQSDYYIIEASFDLPVHLKNGDRIGIGARGDFKQVTPLTFRNWVGGISLSYQKRVFKNSRHNHFLMAGLESGLARKSLDTMAYRIYYPNLGKPDCDHFFFPDFSGGLIYQSVRENGNKIVAGISATHLGRPEQVDLPFYRDNSYSLDVCYLVHFNAEFGLSPRFGLSPWIAYYDTPRDKNSSYISRSRVADLGADLIIFFDKERKKSVAIVAGGKDIWFNIFELEGYLVIGAGLNWNRFSFKFTQDLQSYKWAPHIFEVSLIYRPCQ